ncbi:Plant self-incompatibility S1 [Arabidopsis suecica]|uniref:Plant self-incompatibility S1 n=1 Tax=Arabidopsis suecica TaxID=45249 RepID=A0A8T2BH30_ARASU|nr:Plant self-incompatibility S1 [Arabidopsis suecica]
MISTKAYRLFLVSLALALITTSSLSFAAQVFTIKISNTLAPGSNPISLSCISPQRDTWSTVLSRGGSFDFHFDTNQSVKWSCDISSGARKSSFVIFDLNRDKSRCKSDGLCLWQINPDGFYLYVASVQKYQKQFNW